MPCLRFALRVDCSSLLIRQVEDSLGRKTLKYLYSPIFFLNLISTAFNSCLSPYSTYMCLVCRTFTGHLLLNERITNRANTIFFNPVTLTLFPQQFSPIPAWMVYQELSSKFRQQGYWGAGVPLSSWVSETWNGRVQRFQWQVVTFTVQTSLKSEAS